MCGSPGLIAAYRVLHRLVMPRHPSCARIRLAEDRNPRHLVTLQLFFPDYAVVKDRPRRGGEIPNRAGESQRLVGVPGVEPGTSSLSGTRSNQLSYTPKERLKCEL